ncbi:MAG: ergothioneine biosynthesis protein EgtB [Deltaproteobacteria bacterium]
MALAFAVADGLTATPRRLASRLLYDERGAALFEKITELPEYYLTRAEDEILRHHAHAIHETTGASTLIELGSGSSTKTRHLLDAWSARDDAQYVAVDVCAEALDQAAAGLQGAYPSLELHQICGSFEHAFAQFRAFSPATVAFLGSTIGNLDERELNAFIGGLADALSDGDHLLLGIDLVKEKEVLEAAYDDASGVTAEFTRNLFHRINRELGCGLDVDSIDHISWWNESLERIEIHAQFRREAQIDLPQIGRSFRIARGEWIHTEISRKFRLGEMEARLARSGFVPVESFLDQQRQFALILARREGADSARRQRTRLAGELRETRARTLELIDVLPETALLEQHDPLMSPIVWDLNHIANFEEQWLDRACDLPATEERLRRDALYEAIAHSRASRGQLELPSAAASRHELTRTRERLEALLQRAEGRTRTPLLRDDFLFHMLIQHEAQHAETILQTIGLIPELVCDLPQSTSPVTSERHLRAEMVRIPAGRYRIGTDDRQRAYDNERPCHEVDLGAFRMAISPVTNGEFLAFVQSGGYQSGEFWSTAGDAWRQHSRAQAPLRWIHHKQGFRESAYGRVLPLDLRQPVIHICYFEAEAYARFRGARLPTEAEWEVAASADLETGDQRRFPWGDRAASAEHADLGQRRFAPATSAAHPAGRSYFGCEDMLGSVWEWTASEFAPWPGFHAWPYAEYSEVYFNKGYKVLRGGSWATSPLAIRNTFRNWDLPQRRQIMSGLRLAADD